MTEKQSSPLSSRSIPIAVLIGLTLLSGVVHGYLDGRWSQPADLKAQGSLLEQLPDSFGDWQLVDALSLDESAAELLRCYGSANRIYRHRDKDITINVAIMFGPRGPIAVHTPEVCYDGAGAEQIRDRLLERIATVDNRHELWSVVFSRLSGEPDFEVWFAWSDGGKWQAAKHPRFWMTESLYKIQLSGPVGQGSEQPCREFLEAFLPELEKFIR